MIANIFIRIATCSSTYSRAGKPSNPVQSSVSDYHPTLQYFDPDGDLKLKVGPESQHEIFVVSSKAMCLVCQPWRAMFGSDSQFIEGTRSSDTVIPLPDDDVNALKILLNAAHLRFPLIPKTLDFATLLQVAIVCDKYDAAGVVQPWLDAWLKHAVKHRQTPLHEGWLMISYAFGLQSTFLEAASVIVCDLEIRSNGLFNSARLRYRNRQFLDEDRMPPDILGKARFLMLPI